MPEWAVNCILIAISIWPLIRIERWIHRHVQGLGLLLTNNPQAAVLIYYLIFVPGVALHEVSQFLLAKLLGVEVKQFRIWPEDQQGVIRLGLVEIDQRKTDTVRATLIGVIPLVTGIAMIAWIGNARFDVEILFTALSTGDLPTIAEGIREFLRAPDFWLWFYLLFAFATAMLPEEHDEINWWIIVAPAAGLIVFLLVLDLGILVQAWLEGPFTLLTEAVAFALWMSLGIDAFMWALLSVAEFIFSRILQRELEYN
ncbi:MAG: hypothetical protein ACFB51_15995, partial [Anaerolineae bacterium]